MILSSLVITTRWHASSCTALVLFAGPDDPWAGPLRYESVVRETGVKALCVTLGVVLGSSMKAIGSRTFDSKHGQ